MRMLSQREAYGKSLVDIGKENDRIFVLEADLGKSTMSILFEREIPERYFEMGIGEANMTAVAAGMSLMGKIPFINTFAVFASGRSFEQIRQSICIAGLNVKIVGSSAGLSDFGDGSTHQSIEDIAIMRALPNMTVLSPADAVEVKNMVKCLVDHEGPAYMRICRSNMPVVIDPDAPYEFGKAIPLREAGDVAIFSTGLMTSVALEAADELAEQGIKVRVVNVGCIKPMDNRTVLEIANEVRGIVTAEEHSVIGGLGSAICELLAERRKPVTIKRLGINDHFGTSAHSHDELLDHYGLTKETIVKMVKSF